MIISNTKLDNLLKNLLQKKVSFIIDNKTYKTGKVILYMQKYFYIVFYLFSSKKKKQEKFEVPIPFEFKINDNETQILFDYRIITLAQGNKEIAEKLSIKNIKNKFLNKMLIISICHE